MTTCASYSLYGHWIQSADGATVNVLENPGGGVFLFIICYNFGRMHQTLRVTPAMEAGVSNHVWTIEEMVNLLEETEAKQPRKRGPYKKKSKP